MIQSAQDLREAYRALEEGFVVDRSLVGCFVAALERASQRADTDQADWGRSSEVTKSENVAALVALLEHAGADSGR